MKWISNTYDPKMPDAPLQVIPGFFESMDEAWQHKLEWLRGKIIGDPQGSEKYTADELKAMHMVGVYAQDGDA